VSLDAYLASELGGRIGALEDRVYSRRRIIEAAGEAATGNGVTVVTAATGSSTFASNALAAEAALRPIFGPQPRRPPHDSPTETARERGFSEKRMMGLEPTTFCMATRPDTPMLVHQKHG
jgi:hypothetical protein